MKQRILVSILFCLAQTIAFAQQTGKVILYFNYGKGDLTTSSKLKVEALAAKSAKVISLELIGHTDNDGSEDYNLKLSQDRAKTVQQYLISKGVQIEKMKVAYYGKSQPIASNDTPQGKQKNRRVEISIVFADDITDNDKNVIEPFVNYAALKTLPCDPSTYELATKEILYFNYGRHEVTENSQTKINNLLGRLLNKNIVEIDLSGHTDGDGSITYNLKLSQERVIIVQHYLNSQGIVDDKFKSAYYGKSHPIASNDTEAGKQKNRRVEMIVKFNDCIELKKSDKEFTKNTNTIGNNIEVASKTQATATTPDNVAVQSNFDNNSLTADNRTNISNHETTSTQNTPAPIYIAEVQSLPQHQEVATQKNVEVATTNGDQASATNEETKSEQIEIEQAKREPGNPVATKPTSEITQTENTTPSTNQESEIQTSSNEVSNQEIIQSEISLKPSQQEHSTQKIEIDSVGNGILVTSQQTNSNENTVSIPVVETKPNEGETKNENIVLPSESKKIFADSTKSLIPASISTETAKTQEISSHENLPMAVPTTEIPQRNVNESSQKMATLETSVTPTESGSARNDDTHNENNADKMNIEISTPKSDSTATIAAIEIQPNYAEVKDEKIAHFEVAIKYDSTHQVDAVDSNAKSEGEIALHKNDVQTFMVPTKEDVTINGEQGTSVTFFKDSFVDKNGEAIKEDTVKIQLQEVYKKSDMINHTIATASDGELLESAGMVNVEVVSQNSDEVFLAKNSSYEVKFPTESKQSDMNLFYSDQSSKGQNWTLAERAPEKDSASIVNQQMMDKYVFKSSKLGWLNCDRFTGMNNKTNLRINLDDPDETNVCLVFKNINSVLNISKKNKDLVFSRIPIGEEATLVAFSKRDNQIFYASKSLTIEKNKIETLTMQKLTEAEFQQRIRQFN